MLMRVMHIGYSPRYAEGGKSDYLTLFVEEGRSLPTCCATPVITIPP